MKERMRILLLPLLFLIFLSQPARADVVDDAFADAFMMLEKALPRLDANRFGIDLAAYRDALGVHRFRSTHWGGTIKMDVEVPRSASGDCGRYAAYVRIPPKDGVVALVICPQFRESGTRALRALTILHEVVHVVAGPDECRAMSFAAQVEKLAGKSVTNVERYWNANGCAQSGFRLP